MKRAIIAIAVMLSAAFLMAQVGNTINALTAIDAVAAGDSVAIWDADGADTNKATITQISTALGSIVFTDLDTDYGNETITSTYDMGGANLEIPNSDTLPGTCTEGDIYYEVDNLKFVYMCEPADTWNWIGPASTQHMVYNFMPNDFSPNTVTPAGVAGAPAVATDAGSTYDMQYIAFDKDTDECRGVSLQVPESVLSSGAVRFRIYAYAATDPGTTENVVWNIREADRPHQSDWQVALATHAQTSPNFTSGPAGVDDLVETDWTITVSAAGWTAGEFVTLFVCRDADNGADDLDQDALMIGFSVETSLAIQES
jgi:hypothetical protein